MTPARTAVTRRCASSSTSSNKDFDPSVHFDSRYIGHYRDPAMFTVSPKAAHPSSSLTSSLPAARSRAVPRSSHPALRRRTSLSEPLNAVRVSAAHASRSPPSSAAASTSAILRTRRNDSSGDSVNAARRSRVDMEKRWGAGSPTGNGSSGRVGASSASTAPKKTALLFPGSGSQYVGMISFLLKEFKVARETWEEAEDALSQFERWRKDLNLHELPDLKHLDLPNWPTWQKERSEKELRQIVLNGPQDELTRSSNAQPAICITSIALLRVLEQEFGVPVSSTCTHFAGHSSGEYSACVASGVISFAEGVNLTRLHGLLTSRTLQLSSLKSYSEYDANDEERAQMSALVLQSGRNVDEVKRALAKVREKYKGNSGMVEIASYNSSTQLVLSGSRAGVLRACEKLEDKQIAARAADLPVFAPFHCSFMSPAAIGMRHAWEHGVTARAPRAPIVSNLDAGLITTPEQLKSDIVASIHKPVLWQPALDVMRDAGVERYVFIGPGKALANLARKEARTGSWKHLKELEVASVATLDDLKDLRESHEEQQRSQMTASVSIPHDNLTSDAPAAAP